MEDDEWVVDDLGIPDEAWVHRRLPQNSGATTKDLASGAECLGYGAFSYKDEDGMSAYLSHLMDREGIGPDDLVDWSRDKLARVTMLVVRRSEPGPPYTGKGRPVGRVAQGRDKETPGGAIEREALLYPADERVRRSHGLVRIEERPPGKELWNAFRVKLMLEAECRFAPGEEWQVNVDSALAP